MLMRGQDVRVVVTRDDKEVIALRDINSLTVEFGLTVVTRQFVGQESTRSHGQNNAAVLTLEVDPDRPDFWALIDAQRAANRPNTERVAVEIGVSASFNMGSEGRVRYSFPACVLGSAQNRQTGKDDTVKGSLTLTCDNPERI